MKTFFPIPFADRFQGMPAAAIFHRPALGLRRFLPLLLLVPLLLVALPRQVLAGEGGPSTYGPPPELPPGSNAQEEDTPRRDIHMGNVDHSQMGTDAEGNVIMEVRPRPKKNQGQPQVGPFFIYPQVGMPGGMPGMGAQPGMGQPSIGGQQGQQSGSQMFPPSDVWRTTRTPAGR